jgi:hypothetical protein
MPTDIGCLQAPLPFSVTRLRTQLRKSYERTHIDIFIVLMHQWLDVFLKPSGLLWVALSKYRRYFSLCAFSQAVQLFYFSLSILTSSSVSLISRWFSWQSPASWAFWLFCSLHSQLPSAISERQTQQHASPTASCTTAVAPTRCSVPATSFAAPKTARAK